MSLNAGDITAILRLQDDLSPALRSVQAAAQTALGTMAAAGDQAQAALTAQQAKLRDDLKKTEQEIKDLQQAMKDYAGINPAANPLPKMLADAQQSAASLKTELGNVTAALKAQEGAADGAAGATKRNSQSQDENTESAKRQVAALRDVATAMKAVGDTLTLTVSAPLAAGVGASVAFATQFESSMTKVQTLGGASAAEVGKLRDQILQLAPAVGLGPAELAKGLYPIESAGFRGAEAMDILTRSAKLSAMGFGDMEVITRTMVGALLAYHDQGLSAAQAADILVATVQKGNMPVADLAGSLGRINAIAATMGISFGEVGAAIATFTHMGVSSAEAVTGLRAILINLEAPSKRTKDALAEIGVTVEGVRKSIDDNGLAATLISLIDKTHGNVEVLHDLIPNVRGLAEALSIAKQNGDLYLINTDAIKNANGTLDANFKEVSQTAAFMWDQIKAQLEVVAVQFGTELLPQIKALVPTIKNLLDTLLEAAKLFGDLPKPVQSFVEVMIGIGIVGGPVLSALGRLLDVWIKIKVAIDAAAGSMIPGWLAKLLGLGASDLLVPAVTIPTAGGFLYENLKSGPGDKANAANGLGLERHTGGEDDFAALRALADRSHPFAAAGGGYRGLSPDEASAYADFVGPRLPDGLAAGTTAADILGGLSDAAGPGRKTKQQLAADKKEATLAEQYAHAFKSYDDVLNLIGNDAYEGIASDLARGVKPEAIANAYQLSPTVVADVQRAEAAEAKLAKEREAAATAEYNNVVAFRKEGADALKAIDKGLHPQRAFDLGLLLETNPGAVPFAAKQTVSGLGFLAQDPSYDPRTGKTGVGPGMQAVRNDPSALSKTLLGSADAVPQIILQAFTGGGGVSGALNAVGGQFGSGLMGNIFGQAGKSGLLQGLSATSLVGNLLGSAMPIIGSLIGPAISAIAGMFHKPEYKKIVADSARDWGTTFSDELAKSIEATEKSQHVGRNEATLLNLSKVIGEAGGLSDQNLGLYEGKLRDVFSAVETHALTAAQATQVLDQNFAAFVTAATDKTGLLDGHMRELIALNQRFGTDSKAIGDYLKQQAKDVTDGFNKVAASYSKLATGATPGSAADPARFAGQGQLADLAFQNARGSGLGLVDAMAAIGPGLDALRAAQAKLNQPIDAAAQHLLELRGISQANPDAFGATDGLRQMATGLANSNSMTPEAYAAVAAEAARNVGDLEGLGLSHHDALDASKETLQVLYELQRRDPSLTLAPELQKLVDDAKADGLVGDKQLSAAERSALSLTHISDGIDELVRKAGGTVPGGAAPGTPGPMTAPGIPGPLAPEDVPAGAGVLPGDYHGGGSDDGREPLKMAAGGDFLVTKPTLFLAGEAGPERATFSGANNLGDRGGQVFKAYNITVNVRDDVDARRFADLLRQDGVEIFLEELEDGRGTKRLSRALEAVA